MTEYLGHTQTASYMTGPRLATECPTFLPSIGTVQSAQYASRPAYDTYPAPSPLRRSLTTLPWRPATYYNTAKLKPASAVTRSVPEPLSYRNSLSQMESDRIPPVIAAARNALYTRYTPCDWQRALCTNFMTSDHVRNAGERLRADAVRLAREMDEKTKRAQGDVGKRIGERLSDINFWKRELANETDMMLQENNNLLETKRILEKTLKETENPLQLAQEALYQREKRQGVDLVHDQVEQELIGEIDGIKRAQERMRQALERANTQYSLNRAAQHELEKDEGDKFIAKNIDNTAHNLKNTSRGIAFHNGIELVDNTNSVPETWAKFTNDNIQRSQAERAASKQLRNELDTIMTQAINDMWHHWNNVNKALTARIQDTTEAANKTEVHLSKVLQELFDMQKNIEFLKKSIQDKEAPLQVAQSRLEIRLHRPNVEATRDAAQHRLVEEVHEIYDTVDKLQQKLREAENAQQNLLQTKSMLEHDLAVKKNSLFLDREKVMGMRKAFPMAHRMTQY